MTKRHAIFLGIAIISIAHSSNTNDLQPWNIPNDKHLVTSLDNFVTNEIPTKFDTLEIKKTYSYEAPNDELNNNSSQVKYEEKKTHEILTEIFQKLLKTEQQNNFIITKLKELSITTNILDELIGNTITALSEYKESISHLEQKVAQLESNSVERTTRNGHQGIQVTVKDNPTHHRKVSF